jgi:CubicO group peptidase (beta-lactamase class C family)
MRRTAAIAASLVAAALTTVPVFSQTDGMFPADLRAGVDRIAREVLAKTGVPSASLAIVKDGHIAYVEAYGDARLDTRTPARPGMRYSIGSISKQFTAAAILMLAEERKLSLDDPVSRFAPDLTRANEVTIRQLLSHTSAMGLLARTASPVMLKGNTADGILDAEPGSRSISSRARSTSSNTNFVIAGLIVKAPALLPGSSARAFSLRWA